MVCGVRTEEGVQKTSSLYINRDNTYNPRNSTTKEVSYRLTEIYVKIKALTQLKDNLKTIVFSLGDRKLNQVC